MIMYSDQATPDTGRTPASPFHAMHEAMRTHDQAVAAALIAAYPHLDWTPDEHALAQRHGTIAA
jgi:hypothetical protein